MIFWRPWVMSPRASATRPVWTRPRFFFSTDVARDSAKRALWERLCSLDDACKAVQSRSGAASEEVRSRRRLINGAQ